MWLTRVFTKRRLIGLAVLFALWVLVAWAGARLLIVQAPLERASAILVLGGSATYRERTQVAARLYHEGRAPLIILTDDGGKSGWSRSAGRNPLFVERAQAELVGMGVPESAITILPGTVGSTHDEAVALRGFIFARGLKSLLVVTSAYHSRRALRTMRDEMIGTGLTVGLIAAPTGEQTPRPLLWWTRPRGWPLVAGEYVKIVYYWLYYWK